MVGGNLEIIAEGIWNTVRFFIICEIIAVSRQNKTWSDVSEFEKNGEIKGDILGYKEIGRELVMIM